MCNLQLKSASQYYVFVIDLSFLVLLSLFACLLNTCFQRSILPSFLGCHSLLEALHVVLQFHFCNHAAHFFSSIIRGEAFCQWLSKQQWMILSFNSISSPLLIHRPHIHVTLAYRN